MNLVADILVVGVAMNGHHQPLLYTERVVECLGQRRQTVRRATGIGDRLGCGTEGVVIHAQHDRRINRILGRHRKDHMLGARLDVVAIATAVALLRSEYARRFDRDAHAQRLPRKLGGITNGRHLDGAAVDHQPIGRSLNGPVKPPHDRVIFEKVREVLGTGQIVDGNEFEFALSLKQNPCHRPANAAKPIDRNLC